MLRFLVVDDHHSAVKGLTQLLTEDGHAVCPFTGGAEAIDALERQPFDAVVTDFEMPDVDGLAVVRAARVHHPRACLVVVSEMADQHEQALAAAGACIIADKPLDYDAMTRALTECQTRGGPGAHGHCYMTGRLPGPARVRTRRP